MRKVLFCILTALLYKAVWCIDLTVRTKEGLVQGVEAGDGSYTMFLGVRYAVVDPENPFGVAKSKPNYDGVFKATADSPSCPQGSVSSSTEMSGALDCLSVNVYVPKSASSNNKLPVMAWIFGGGFEGGSNSKDMYGPDYLVRYDVILVTINYRLGPYGFMCLNVPSVPGNTGLKDQQMALKWIHDNIESFGGDKDKVTLFGQSAGAGSTQYHVLNPTSNKYISQVILQSATVFTDGIIERDDAEVPLRLAKQLGYNPNTIEDALNILKNVSTGDVIKAGTKLSINYKPCIERKFEGVDGFMVTSPQRLLEAAEYRGIPMMIGHTSIEGKNGPREGGKKNISATLKNRFNFNKNGLPIAAKLVEDYYVGYENQDTGLIDFDSDFTYNYGSHKSIKYHLHQSNKPIYQFVFGYVGSHVDAFSPTGINNRTGVGHGEDISYLLKDSKKNNTAEDQLVIDRFSTMWTNFAKYGNPTPKTTTLLPVCWPNSSVEAPYYLWIDADLTVGQKLFHDRMAFWDLFFVAYGKDYWLY